MGSSLFAVPFVLAWMIWQPDQSGQDTVVTYETVQLIFEDNCIMCHNGPKAPRGLQLTSYEKVMKGSERGPVIHSGDPERSELFRRVRGISVPRMPLSGPPWLDESDIMQLESWIRNGALPGPIAAHKAEADSGNDAERKSKGAVTYADVASIFSNNCVKCHNHKGLKGPPPEGLRLGTYKDIMEGTERVYVIPGRPDASELVRKIRGQSLPRMPFDGPPYLTEEEIALIEAWIAQGSQDETGRVANIPVGRRVRLRGRLTGRWVLDDLVLVTNARTEIKKLPVVGEYVEVRGRVDNNGGIVAERIRAR